MTDQQERVARAIGKVIAPGREWGITMSVPDMISRAAAAAIAAMDHPSADDEARLSAALAPDPMAAIDAIRALNTCGTEADLAAAWISMQPMLANVSVADQVRVTMRYLTRMAMLERTTVEA